MLRVPTLDEAQGVMFRCPFPGHGHMVVVWFANPRVLPPADSNHTPSPRWQMSGTGLVDLTLQPSVDVKGGPDCSSCWHGYVQNGVIT
mgnify:CR=1 FL=1